MWLLYYLITVNLIGFVLMGIDKWKSRTGFWRISENTLMLTALIGGSLGVYSGLNTFHHKTKHFKFKVIVPVILLIQTMIIGWFIFSSYY